MKVIVLDDDPTGSQTVHSCPLLLGWDAETLRQGLAHPSPLLFLLANTRALDPAAAAQRVRQIARALRPALAEACADGGIDHWLLVSRGDSTLRSHAPLELEVLAEELGPDPWDACFLVPAFLPGGRTTVDGEHRLHGVPVHTTPFAADRLFGYGTSFLPAWLEEKTGGRIPAAAVERISLAELEAAGSRSGLVGLCYRLAGLEGSRWVVVDAERPQHLAALGAAVRELTAPTAAEGWGRPRRFLFQSAASLLNGMVGIGPQPLAAAALAGLRRRDGHGVPLPGLVLVGSHVPLADAQLEGLLAEPACALVELKVTPVARWLADGAAAEGLAGLEAVLGERLAAVLAAGLTPVLATSRGELDCGELDFGAVARRRLGLELAGLMARLAAALAPQLGYLISKGGITSHTLLAEGLQLASVELQGQLLPGLSLVLTPADAAVPALPVLTFPGNLGDATTLQEAWAWMEGLRG